jgi:hypothetical protein
MSVEQDILGGLIAKQTITEIGREVGLSRDAVRRRMAKLSAMLDDTRIVDPTANAVLTLERERTVLQSEVETLKKKLRATHLDGSLFERLAAVIREDTAPFMTPLLQAPQDVSGDGGVVDAVLLLSDEHGDEVLTADATNGLEVYDFRVFQMRLNRLKDKVLLWTQHLRPAHRFNRLFIFKLGDAVNGDIHGAGPRNDFGNTLKAAIAVGDAEAAAIDTLSQYFPGGVVVVGVSGNHPRRAVRKDFDGPHDNFDYLVGTQIATRLANNPNVTVVLPESYTAYVDVGGRVWALNHGDDVVGYSGIPWVGFDKRNNRIQSILATADERADYFVYGHYHTAASFASAGGQSFHSGPWTFVDTYAMNKHALGGHEPTQTLFVVHEKFGVILPIPIFTRDMVAEREQYDTVPVAAGVVEDVAPAFRPDSLHVVTP